MANLTQDSITFGKYKGKTLPYVLKDRKYCNWLLKQDWFKNYEYLYNRVEEYDPTKFFLPDERIDEFLAVEDFVEYYPYFNLTPLNNLEISLSQEYESCYKFYLEMMEDLKNKILCRFDQNKENAFAIKAPSRWLKKFESTYNIPRTIFKKFLVEHDIPNVPYIVERIKKEGGIDYKGAKSYLIAKKKSEEQESWWEIQLKKKYGEDISTQFKFRDCIFDFINIKQNILYECKIGIKDFNEEQYRKYLLTLGHYDIVYLISRDVIIHIPERTIYVQGDENICDIFRMTQALKKERDKTKFDDLIKSFDVKNVEDISRIL